MTDRKRELLLIGVDVAAVALTAVGTTLSLVPFDFLVQQSIRHPELDWSAIYLAGRDAGVAALFAGIAFGGFSAFRRRLLGRMLLLVAVLLLVMILRGGFFGAIAIAIPAVAWTVVLGVSAPQGQQVTRGCVAGLFIAGALALLPLGYYLPILFAGLSGLAGGGHGPSSDATSSQIASCLVPFAIASVCLVALGVFILRRKKDV